MTYTTNLNLKKPATTDSISIGDLNDNADTLDLQLSGRVGRNLLFNPWFTVNQRAANGNISTGAYGVDRWRAHSNDPYFVSMQTGSVTIPADLYIEQLFEESYIAPGTYTFGVKTSQTSGTIQVYLSDGTNSYGGSASIANGFGCITITVLSGFGTTGQFIRISNTGSTSITLTSVKLERGSVSTLELDNPPDYAAEIAKCRRFYNKSSLCGYGYFTTESKARIIVPIGQMRANPATTLLVNPNILSTSGTVITATNCESPAHSGPYGLSVWLSGLSSSSYSQNTCCVCVDGSAEFDAELT